MAMAKMMVLLVVVVAVVGSLQAVDICDMTEDGLMACKPSVTNPDPAEPSPECCKAISGADLKCLCSYRDSRVLPSFGIDPVLAVGLPVKCNLPAPPC
ncbi:Bifunctional inhibitor/plant lipid transfer protein/seed storage helical domain-containing protein [Artemisia annua]|uniref:Bifunctional inhibitor/plant lipid transfer protein/seed storage helical domain-containing protein n=1 Tax=Artemisia annua TaxID=35608 RepID=A0A2U1LHZ3_ARTAN|nr:Bifunctional inhibitor/plant lipid transfer protein/seed storage helical domain-containing protein [Artemisia annua]